MKARGITLIEVLAAVVLLAALSAVCVGLVRDASQSLEDDPSAVSIESSRLAWLASEVGDHPLAFGIDNRDSGPQTRTGNLELADGAPAWCRDVRWTLHAPSDSAINRAWVELELDGSVAWTVVELEEAEQPTPEAQE